MAISSMSKVVQLTRVGVAAACVLLLSACASQFRSEVATFHKMLAPAGETFRIVPTDPAKQGSLEFESYANLVRGEMVKRGYTPVNAGNAAALDVKVDYSVSEPVEKVETRPGTGFSSFGFGPYWGPYYGAFGGYGGYQRSGFGGYGGRFGYYDPFWGPSYYNGFGGLWDQPEVYSYSVYTRKLNVDIARGGKDGEQVYQGRLESPGRDNRLPEVMPYMVQAMFLDFPGQSGVTRKVTIEIPAKR
jgi:Domain of unknown function (DUF4136)